jgi:hypothetical protein
MILFAFHDENGTITNANRQEIVAKLSASRILDVKSFLRINNPHQLVKILDPLLTYRKCSGKQSNKITFYVAFGCFILLFFCGFVKTDPTTNRNFPFITLYMDRGMRGVVSEDLLALFPPTCNCINITQYGVDANDSKRQLQQHPRQ